MSRLFLLALTVSFILGTPTAHAQSASVDNGRVVLENDIIRFEIHASTGAGAPIDAVSFRDIRSNTELLANPPSGSLFEIALDGALVSSGDPVWRFISHETRSLANGGLEVTARYRIESGPGTGGLVELDLQVFPDSPLIRQRLSIASPESASVAMTYHDGKPHIVFPRLSVDVQSDPVVTTETRIATWNAELVDASASTNAYDERAQEVGWREGRNLANNYMYHPTRTTRAISPSGATSVKGPIVFARVAPELTWVTLYEHGSPDDDPEQDYIRLEAASTGTETALSVRTRSGAYFDGDVFTESNPFRSVWTAIGPSVSGDRDAAEAVVWDYLLTWITEHAASREPIIYYNTWGMQREAVDRGLDPREVLTMERVLEDVDDASQLGIDQFVLDDGWQNTFGDWVPHPDRYPDGLAALHAKLEEKDIIFGIWIATLANDADSEIANRRPEWLVLDEAGEPEIGNWDRQVFCFVSDYRDYYLDVSKRLIDDGARYFKWDGIDKHLCDSPHHHHGDESQTPEDRRMRSGYMLSGYLADVARELREYHPEIVVEFDVTEPGRSVGLEFLSQGRYFWINNGASWYGDHSGYRARSMRLVPALYHGIIPPVLQTGANYPHNHPDYMAQRYNVSSSLLGGLGFWGDLKQMDREERLQVGTYVDAFRPTKEVMARVRPTVEGRVGGSPEIYTYIDGDAGEGQVVAFSGTALRHTHRVADLDADKVLAVVGNAYSIDARGLLIDFVFPHAEVAREAFVRSNHGNGIRVVSSTSWLKDVEVEDTTLVLHAGAPGVHDILWPAPLGAPRVGGSDGLSIETGEVQQGHVRIRVQTTRPDSRVVVEPSLDTSTRR